MWSWLYRTVPGPRVVRVAVVLAVMAVGVWALFRWGFPWAAQHVPGLGQDPDVG